MSKGFEKYQERISKLNFLGKDLARRAKSKCELCRTSGVPLRSYELEPLPTDPDIDNTLLLCETCLKWISKPNKSNLDHWRILNETVWSEIPAAQVMAVRILRHIGKDLPWANEYLENVFLEPEIEDWISKAPL